MRLLRDMLAAGLLALALVPPARAEDAGAMALALSAADARDWVTARDAARRSGPMAEALVGWQALRAGHGGPSDYIGFVHAHGDWPGLALLRPQQRIGVFHHGFDHADNVQRVFGTIWV